MKKLGLIILVLLLAFALPVYAQTRGPLTNQWASWASVTTSKTFIFPNNSRDLWIHNGSAVDIVIDIKGNTIDEDFYKTGSALLNTTFQLNGTDSIYLQDIITPSITVRSETGAAASPVSVVVTF